MEVEADSHVGFAIGSVGKGILHGLRHHPVNHTNGWFLWFGEYSDKDDFFVPLCIKHLPDYIQQDISEYLELPPGFRFLIDGLNYEDVWYDEQLLQVD